MNVARVQEIFAGLGEMNVVLDQTPELGLEYFKQRMFDCRRHNDLLTEWLIELNRDMSSARRSLRAAEVSKELARDSSQMKILRDEVRELQGRVEDLRYLEVAIKVKQSNLKQIGSDIRLIVGIVQDGLRYGGGEVQPGDKTAPVGRKPVKPKPNRVVVEAPPSAAVPEAQEQDISEIVGFTVGAEALAAEAALLHALPDVIAAPVASETEAFDIAAFLDS